jgi:hypothetical protein
MNRVISKVTEAIKHEARVSSQSKANENKEVDNSPTGTPYADRKQH